ncbi:MAG: hypothetical protein ACKOB3_00230 [Holophagaceae bacterium]
MGTQLSTLPSTLQSGRLLQLMEPRSVLTITTSAQLRVIDHITMVLGIDTKPGIEMGSAISNFMSACQISCLLYRMH